MQSFQYTPSASLLALAAMVSAILAAYIWNRRALPGAKPAVALMVAIFVWSMGYLLQFMGIELATKIYWTKIQSIGVVSLPLTLFLFALAYSGQQEWLTRQKFSALIIIPIFTLIMAITNESHRLVWSAWSLASTVENNVLLRLVYGPVIWMYTIYAYCLLVASTILIVRALNRRPMEYRGQIISVLVGIAIPWLTNAVSNLVYQLDLTPFAFVISGIAISWSIFKYHLFERVPNEYETVIASMSDAVFILDMRNRIVNFNPAGQQILSRSSEEILGQQTSEVFKNRTDVFEVYQHAMNIREEITINDGNHNRHYELSILPLTDRFDKILGRAVILHEISDRKQVESAMTMARDRALESSRIKSEFLARVSHELRTPLGVIRGYADLLSDPDHGTLSELQNKAVNEIIDSTQRISDMVGELLDEARLAAGAVQLEIKPFNPADILDDVKEKMSVLADQKKLTLTAEIDPDLPQVLTGDPVRINQMVTNLTSNSIKFTRQGGVHIRFHPYDTDNWALEVNDTGPGIPEEVHDSIFEPYRQADSSIPHIFGGTGLGLAIVKHLANLMDGKITVQSEVGKGSKFTVILPRQARASD